jgi:Zn-dependent protease with chaperone function
MNFTEVFESMLLDSHICDTEIAKCNIFAESSFREFHINCMESELKVLKESGTEEDYNYLIEAAEESLFERIKKSIQKIIEALRSYIKRVIEKVKTSVAAEKTRQALNKIKTLIKENPLVKKEKIAINDVKAEFITIDKGIHKLKEKLLKIKSGKTTERDSEDINETIEDIEKSRKKIADDTTAVEVSVEEAVDLLEELVDEANDGAAIKEANDIASDIEKEVDSSKEADESALNNICKICSAKAVLAKAKLSSLINTIMTLWAKLKSKIADIKNKIKGEDNSNNTVEESTDFFNSDNYIGETFSEVFGETITGNDDASYSNSSLMSSPFSSLVINSGSYSSMFEALENEMFNEAYFGKSESLLEAEKILDTLIPIIKHNPLADYTNHPLTRALSNTLKRQFGFKELYITWKRSSKVNPSINTLISSDITFGGKNIVGINKKDGYYDKNHSHVAYITLSSTLPSQVNISGAEYLAAILHEIGHNFDASVYNMIQSIFHILILIPIAATMPLSISLLTTIPPAVLTTGPGKTGYHSINKIVESILDKFPFLKKISDMGRQLGDWFTRTLQVYGSPARLLTIPSFILMSPASHLTGLFTRKGEMFADSFAAAYGYSSELLTMLNKLKLTYQFKMTDSGSLKDAVADLNEHPIRRFFTDLSIAESSIISLFIDGTHGTSINRAKTNLDMLKNDLQNGDFSPDVRASLQQEIINLEKTINDYRKGYIDGNEESNLPFTLCARKLLYNAFNGRSDYIAKLFPDNVVLQGTTESNESVMLTPAVSNNLNNIFNSMISNLE